jgi:hypothetical protein
VLAEIEQDPLAQVADFKLDASRLRCCAEFVTLLPVGLLLGWLLVQFAGRGALAAAIMLPLYYLADGTITLVRRRINGEKVWQAHRSHFYQRAADRGFTVNQVVAHVLAINIALAALAFVTLAAGGAPLRRGIGWLAVAGICARKGRHEPPRRALSLRRHWPGRLKLLRPRSTLALITQPST